VPDQPSGANCDNLAIVDGAIPGGGFASGPPRRASSARELGRADGVEERLDLADEQLIVVSAPHARGPRVDDGPRARR
jgi:hypothetical protein